MRKITKQVVTALATAIALSSAVEAKTVLSAKEHCFQVLWDNNNLTQAFKLKPQQPLTDKKGAVVEVVALDHEWINISNAVDRINQLSGAASYIPASGEETKDIIQVALVGTSYVTNTGGADGKPAFFSISYSLRISSNSPAVGFDGLLTGVRTMTPLDGGTPTQTIIREVVSSRGCSGI
jgi:hypothetical protein